MYKIADLHCDLLAYLQEDPSRSPYDLRARCSVPQMVQGGVRLQTMAIYTATVSGSARQGMHQCQIYKQLPSLFSELKFYDKSAPTENSQISILYAIENASSFCEENDSLEDGLSGLNSMIEQAGKPLYMSLTWNTENRFGGGALTQMGLKEDGRILLDFLSTHKIAVDLSHTSDSLAHDILNYIDKKCLVMPVIASHSNLRSITNVPRNLPDEIAQEIFKRKGIIGVNFVKYFIGSDDERNFSKHLDKLLRLGGGDHICLGADFFYENDGPLDQRKPADVLYFKNFDNSGSYPRLFDLWGKSLSLSSTQFNKIASGNLFRFLDMRR